MTKLITLILLHLTRIYVQNCFKNSRIGATLVKRLGILVTHCIKLSTRKIGLSVQAASTVEFPLNFATITLE